MKKPPSASATPPIQTTHCVPKRSSRLGGGDAGAPGGGGGVGGPGGGAIGEEAAVVGSICGAGGNRSRGVSGTIDGTEGMLTEAGGSAGSGAGGVDGSGSGGEAGGGGAARGMAVSAAARRCSSA